MHCKRIIRIFTVIIDIYKLNDFSINTVLNFIIRNRITYRQLNILGRSDAPSMDSDKKQGNHTKPLFMSSSVKCNTAYDPYSRCYSGTEYSK